MASGISASGAVKFLTRFTYNVNKSGVIEVTPTDQYLYAMDHTYSQQECLKFDRQGLLIGEIVENAKGPRGWSWFNEDDYWFLRFWLNLPLKVRNDILH